MEKRKTTQVKSSPLPLDFLKMVNGVFSGHYESGLNALEKIKGAPARFEASGNIYPDEVLLCVSLLHQGQMAATSVYASSDFDPKASAPTVQDVLSMCVDAVGTVYDELFSNRIAQLADESLASFENVPFEWTAVEVERKKVYVRLDTANPELEQMTDQWLKKNDPNYRENLEKEQKATENLFFTGPKSNKDPSDNSSGTLH